MSRKGAFIVLEGIDGSGTTTQTERLAQLLEARGVTCHSTREPTGGPVGRLLRRALSQDLEEGGSPIRLDPATLSLLFAADRMDHVMREICPELDAGHVVISDRYALSSLIYQSETSTDPVASLVWLKALNSQALRPDLVLVLDIDPDVAERRRRERGGKEELFERQELQERLALRYRDARRLLPGEEVVLVDADQPVELLTEHLMVLLEERLPGLFARNLPDALG